MLLLAIVLGGSNAWAANTIYSKYGGIWTDADCADWGTTNLSISSNSLLLAGTVKGATTSASQTFSIASGSTVSLKAIIKLGNDCGNATSYDYFNFGGISLKVYRQKKETDAIKLSVDGGEEQIISTTAPGSASYTIKYVVNQSTGDVQYFILYGDANKKTVELNGTIKTQTRLSEVKFGHETKDGAKKISNIYLNTLEIIEEPVASLHLNSNYTYSTFCADWDVDFTNVAGVEAYKASVNNNVVSLTKVAGKVKAGEGILIKNVTNTSYVEIPVSLGATALEGNNLVGVTAAMTAADFTGKTAYILTSDTEFQLITDASTNKLAKGKAYLELPAEAAAKPSSLFFGEATGINGVAVEKKADNAIYNLQGMRVKTPTKGLYIINGKKYRF